MPLYRVQRGATVWYSVEVWAENEEEAEEKGCDLLNEDKHTDEDFGEWFDEAYTDVLDENAPDPNAGSKEEPDLVY